MRRIDILSFIGFVLAVFVILFGIVFKMPTETTKALIDWKSLENFLDWPSIAITVGGTFATLMVAFPAKSFKKIPPHLKIVFFPSQYNPRRSIEQIVELAKEARMKGLLSLEDKLSETDDLFLRNSLMLVVDSVEPGKVKQLLEAELDFLDERHGQDRAFYDKGATFAPAFGMIGTLIGLILMLAGDLQDQTKIASGMAVALITTLYGSLLCNVVFLPISAKLRARHEEEYLCKLIICEGVQAIQAGENPRFIGEKLNKLLPGAYSENSAAEGEEGEDGVVSAPKEKKRKKKARK